jgi:hypothetical protein
MNMLTVKQQFIWFSLVIVGLALAACQASMVAVTVSPTPSVASLQVTGEPLLATTTTSEATRTPLPTSTEVPTITPSLSPTATISPSPTATSVPLPTPRPTLTSNEARLIIDDWFREPPCLLPCWWNLIPGQSNWVEVNQQLDYLGWRGPPEESKSRMGHYDNTRYTWIDYPDRHTLNSFFSFYFDPDDSVGSLHNRFGV